MMLKWVPHQKTIEAIYTLYKLTSQGSGRTGSVKVFSQATLTYSCLYLLREPYGSKLLLKII